MTLHTQQVKVACARWKCDAGSFAAIQGDASVLTWGDPDDGGDCSDIQDRLVNVQKIQGVALCLCCRSWRRKCCDVGQSKLWRRQRGNPGIGFLGTLNYNYNKEPPKLCW